MHGRHGAVTNGDNCDDAGSWGVAADRVCWPAYANNPIRSASVVFLQPSPDPTGYASKMRTSSATDPSAPDRLVDGGFPVRGLHPRHAGLVGSDLVGQLMIEVMRADAGQLAAISRALGERTSARRAG